MGEHKFYWLSDKVTRKETLGYGDGLFSVKKILKGERILIIGGYIMSVEDESKLPGKCSDNGVQISEDLVICISRNDEWGGFNYLNHSCSPNAGFNGQIFLVAMRDIEKNEQISIDYAMVLHSVKRGPKYKLNCLCDSKKCRKIITENDWKIPALQKKYKGFFQPYLQGKINSM